MKARDHPTPDKRARTLHGLWCPVRVADETTQENRDLLAQTEESAEGRGLPREVFEDRPQPGEGGQPDEGADREEGENPAAGAAPGEGVETEEIEEMEGFEQAEQAGEEGEEGKSESETETEGFERGGELGADTLKGETPTMEPEHPSGEDQIQGSVGLDTAEESNMNAIEAAQVQEDEQREVEPVSSSATTCPQCHRNCHSNWNLLLHLAKCKANSQNLELKTPPLAQCTNCFRCFTPQMLRTHRISGSCVRLTRAELEKEGAVICPHCSRSFSSPGNLQMHLDAKKKCTKRWGAAVPSSPSPFPTPPPPSPVGDPSPTSTTYLISNHRSQARKF